MTRRDVDPHDVQAITRTAFGFLRRAMYLLLRVGQADRARAFLRDLQSTTMAELALGGRRSDLSEAIQVAFTASGLRALGIETDVVDRFAPEFVEGMTGRCGSATSAPMRRTVGPGATASASRICS
jgi:hypothetical protein